jgi:HSP20 family protein
MSEDVVNRSNGNAEVAVQQPPTARARNPFGDVLRLDPFDLFRNFYTNLAPAASGVEIARTENGYSVEIGVAGFAPDQIDVTYKDGAVTVSGKSDRRTFTRSLMLSDDIDPDNISARVEHGLLTLTLNRHPQTQPKKIAIQQ